MRIEEAGPFRLVSMKSSAGFYFYGSLNDFLPNSLKNNWITFEFTGNPSIKDSIEALGIPHTEVEVILVNKSPVNFNYGIAPEDAVEVYPMDYKEHPRGTLTLINKQSIPHKFICDVHLGKLTRLLRLLGFDVYYNQHLDDRLIAEIADLENRTVLTCDVGLLKYKAIKHGYWLRSQNLEEQLTEVLNRFKLINKMAPFSRCLACNGIIKQVAKEAVVDLIPAQTKQHFNEFYRCTDCNRIYWKGSHYKKMLQFVEHIKDRCKTD